MALNDSQTQIAAGIVKEASEMTASAIEVRKLTRVLGKRTVLNNIDLDVATGQVFGYLGPNGAGKTTTLRILLGLIKPTSGHALVLGQDVTQLGRDVTSRIGVVLEYPGFYERLSAWQNLDYYGRIFRLPEPVRSRRAEELLRDADLWVFRKDKAGTLSKGMKQRLAIARALLHDPELVFLDEPTSGLDPEATREIRDLILRLAHERGKTIFLNSHHLDEVERTCSHIAILHQGHIRAHGTVELLRRQFAHLLMEITFNENTELRHLFPVLTSLPQLNKYQVLDSHRIMVELREESSEATLISALTQLGAQVSAIRHLEPSLEDVYMSIIKEANPDA